MKTKLGSCLETAKNDYCSFMSSNVDNFWGKNGYKDRLIQMDVFTEVMLSHFEFDEINLIETGVSGNLSYGLFGFFLGSLVSNYGGQMHSVDLNCESCKSSEEIFSKNIKNLKYKTYCKDSVEFLKYPPIIPNIVHLDSYDFNLYNPFPSALHCWKEFEAIEKLMPTGGIIFIDDNWMKGTHLQWFQNGNESLEEIKYPVIGKGANIYNEVLQNRTNFELLDEFHRPFKNIKIYIKKK